MNFRLQAKSYASSSLDPITVCFVNHGIFLNMGQQIEKSTSQPRPLPRLLLLPLLCSPPIHNHMPSTHPNRQWRTQPERRAPPPRTGPSQRRHDPVDLAPQFLLVAIVPHDDPAPRPSRLAPPRLDPHVRLAVDPVLGVLRAQVRVPRPEPRHLHRRVVDPDHEDGPT